MCRVLGVSASGYDAWQRRRASARAVKDAVLTRRIHTIHLESRGTYGAPRVHAELAAQGIHVGRKRVARLMRAAAVQGVSRRKPLFTTTRDRTARPAPDLVQRNFTVDGPDRLWVADITYVPTGAGFLYLAVVLDAWSRRVVGWAMAPHLRTELVLAALDMAIIQRLPRAVIHHSDQGCQYTSIAYGQRCRAFGVRPSMGAVGDAYDNAMCESFFATLECELLWRTRFRSQAEARMAVFEFLEGLYGLSLGRKMPSGGDDRIRLRAYIRPHRKSHMGSGLDGQCARRGLIWYAVTETNLRVRLSRRRSDLSFHHPGMRNRLRVEVALFLTPPQPLDATRADLLPAGRADLVPRAPMPRARSSPLRRRWLCSAHVAAPGASPIHAAGRGAMRDGAGPRERRGRTASASTDRLALRCDPAGACPPLSVGGARGRARRPAGGHL
jgi:putative transposase